MIEYKACIGKSEKPTEGWSPSTIQYFVGIPFDGLNSAFCKVLVLMIRLALPIIDHKTPEDIQNFLADFNLSSVGDEFVHRSPFSDIVFKSVDKLFVRFHSVYVCE